MWAISLSAFFADSGYQSVLAGFPLFLVIALHQPVWEFGLASAVSYGGGAAFSWAGAALGDRIGHRRLALLGNASIPLLSLSALTGSPAAAIGLLCGGWWARNLRTPSRRVMLVEAVPNEGDRNSVFGFLHALDVGGGAVAGIFVLAAILGHLAFKWIFLVTVAPLALSTLSLSRAHTGEPRGGRPAGPGRRPANRAAVGERPALPGARYLLGASALYGFTFYSVGFPVLTVAKGGRAMAYGIGAFLLFQAASAATGYLLAGRLRTGLRQRFVDLGLLGYAASGLGSVLLAAGYAAHLGIVMLLAGVAVLGFALGVIETLEPSLMSVLRPGRLAGRAFGSLSAARSVGLFAANLVLGLLYGLGPAWSYGYAAAVAAAAAAIVLAAVPAGSAAPG